MKKLFAGLLFILSLAGATVGHEGQKHVLGQVVDIEDNSITVETTGKESKKLTVVVTRETKFQKSGSSASLKDLAMGDRVVVHAKENKEKKLQAVLVIFGNPGQGKRP